MEEKITYPPSTAASGHPTLIQMNLPAEDEPEPMPTREEMSTLYYYNPQRWYEITTSHMPKYRRAAFDFFDMQTTWPAVLFGLLMVAAIVISVTIVILEGMSTLRTYFNEHWRTWFAVDMAVLGIFVFELAGRFYGTPDRVKFLKSFMNWIDIVTIIPFIVEAVVGERREDGYLQFLTLLRVLRLLHGINPRHGNVNVMITFRAMRKSLAQIVALSFYLMILMVITASFLFIAEQETRDPKTGEWMRTVDDKLVSSPYQSVLHSLYPAITTLTTVGYGDITPITPWGRFIAGVAMVFGVLAIALPTSVLGSNFIQEWSLFNRIKYLQEARDRKKRQGSVRSFGKTAENQLLREDNERLSAAVAEIQDRLSEIQPPEYYEEFKRMQMLYFQSEARNRELFEENERLAQENAQLKRAVEMYA